jgi:hypothetical protein
MASSDYVTQAEMVQAVSTVNTAVNELLAGLEVLQPETSDYVTNAEMVAYVTNCVDTWGTLLWDILMELTRLVDEINGEVVLENLVKKLQYLYHTKELIRDKIISTGSGMPYDETFRNYPKWIKGIGGDWILKRVVLFVKSPVTIWLNNVFREQWFYPTFRKITKGVYHVYKRTLEKILNTTPSHKTKTKVAQRQDLSAGHIILSQPSISVYKYKEV